MTAKENRRQVFTRLDPHVYARLEALADHEERSVAATARIVLTRALLDDAATLANGAGDPVAVLAPKPAPPPPPAPPRPPAPPSTGRARKTCASRVPSGSFCKLCGEVHP